ncbi:hypothetical protein BG004_002253 [Podila humilis]|nr:hypothetical protein BG004_002253 [Podila humilis]
MDKHINTTGHVSVQPQQQQEEQLGEQQQQPDLETVPQTPDQKAKGDPSTPAPTSAPTSTATPTPTPAAKPLFLPPATASSSPPSSSPPTSRSKDSKDQPHVKPDDTYLSYLVENTKTVLQTQFHNLKTNVHIIPIEWHAKLHNMVDERMALASLRTVPKDFNNHYGAEVVRMIVDELNEAYETFLVKHPNFNGKISVYALSLGGVAMFDILTCMDDDDPEVTEAEKQEKAQEHNVPASNMSANSDAKQSKNRPIIRKQDQPKFRCHIPKLKFRPHQLFTVGSPVGAVMVMRNLDWESFHPPDDIIHHNLFHPFDPLAYRIEPLIDPTFAAIPAVTMRSYGNTQLFPLSLPSLSSIPLIPESLSAFWETKVPTLPRPSIPTLSTLSQMTQSLKAGRWLSGTGSGSGNQASESSTPGEMTATRQEANDAQKPLDQSSDSDSDSQKEGGLQRTSSKVGASATHGNTRQSRMMDADVSAQEAIVAAAAATYLDQRERGSRMVDSSMFGTNDTTTIGSSQFVHSPSRRPSLGPRRISSQIEDEVEGKKQESYTNSVDRTMPNVQEEHDGENYKDESKVDTSLSQANTGPSDEVPPPLEMEYYLGMESGPTSEEKEMAKGAQCDVVQEDMVRSMPNSPVLDRSSSAIEGIEETVRQERKVPVEDIEDETLEDAPNVGAESNTSSGKKQKLHVGGRPTKVPYRIDHVLQESTVDQYTNEYLLGMRSHFRYWGNRDIAYHILKNMLHPEGTVVGGDVLELTPEMPTPIATPKGAKAAAEAKAKAAGAAYHSLKKKDQEDAKIQHRKSFSFSFFAQDTSEEREGRPSIDSYDGYGLDADGELHGYRYSDLDMGSAANVGFPSNTLYQNSPFSRSSSSGGPSSSSTPMTYEYHHHQHQHQHQSTKRRSSSSASSRYVHTQQQIRQDGNATSSVATAASSSAASSAAGTTSSATHVQPSAFEEGVIIVPELAKPAKLHHRSSRVEEKR